MKRKIHIFLFVIYILVLLRITVFRSGFSLTNFLSGGSVNLALFSDLISVARNDIFTFIYLFVGNLIWFVPLGLLLPIIGLKRKTTFALGFLLSLLIEILQYLFAIGVTELDDLILNTLGCLIGIGVYSFKIHTTERKKKCQKK